MENQPIYLHRKIEFNLFMNIYGDSLHDIEFNIVWVTLQFDTNCDIKINNEVINDIVMWLKVILWFVDMRIYKLF